MARTVATFCHPKSRSAQSVEQRMKTIKLSTALLVQQLLDLETGFALAVGGKLSMGS